MPIRLFDRVKQKTTTSGSGTITLGSSVDAFLNFSSVFSNGDETYYVIENTTDFEVGIGTYNAGTLSRDIVLKSTNNDQLLNLPGDLNTYVFVTYPASGALYITSPSSGSQYQILEKVNDTTNEVRWIDNFAKEVVQFAKNSTHTSLSKGQVVYINGADGTHPTVQLAIGNKETSSSKVIGFLKQDLAQGELGYIITEGFLDGLNTNAASDAGDPMWLSPTISGGVLYGTGNKPHAPDHLVFLGYVIRKNTNNGRIYVKIQNGFELEELHNVAALNPSNGDTIVYSSASGLWLKQPLSSSITGAASGVAFFNGANVLSTNTELVFNSTSGYLGIGTGDPQTALHVNGNLTVDVNSNFYHTSHITRKLYNYALNHLSLLRPATLADQNSSIYTRVGGLNTSSNALGTNKSIYLFNDLTSSGTNDGNYGRSGRNICIFPGGDVGINFLVELSTVPAARLHVRTSGNTNGNAFTISNSSSQYVFTVKDNGNTNLFGNFESSGNGYFVSGLGVGVAVPSAKVEINTVSSSTKGLIIKGAAAQSDNLVEIQNSTGSGLVHIDNMGNISGNASIFANVFKTFSIEAYGSIKNGTVGSDISRLYIWADGRQQAGFGYRSGYDGMLLGDGSYGPIIWMGGTTASYPAIKRNETSINFRLANDSADCSITAASGTFSSGVRYPDGITQTIAYTGQSSSWNINVTGLTDNISSGQSVIFTGIGGTSVLYDNNTNTVTISGAAGSGSSDNTIRDYINVTGSTTLSIDSDVVFIDSTSNIINITLPLASGNGGKQISFKWIAGTNTVELSGSNFETIDGSNTWCIDYIYDSFSVISNNQNWYIF